MGWQFWKSDDRVDLVERGEPAREWDISVVDRPASTAPGSPLPCVNDGDPVRLGERVTLVTTFAHQRTMIRSITVDGEPADVLDTDERGDVVLGDDADLSRVYRSSSILGPDEPGPDEPDGAWPDGSFVMQVLRAEQQGKDALVVGKVAIGTSLERGTRVICTTSPDEDPAYLKVLAVDPAQFHVYAEVKLLLAKADASRFRFGDEVTHVELPRGV
jgi:hypothetical protein